VSHWIPIKTNDVVLYNGHPHIVKDVQITSDGPVFNILPVKNEPTIVHSSQIKLLDSTEAMTRGKAVGYKTADLNSIHLPDNITRAEAQRALQQLARTKKEDSQNDRPDARRRE
jgi:hypothetical protein